MTQAENEDSAPSVAESSPVANERRNWATSRLGRIIAGAAFALKRNRPENSRDPSAVESEKPDLGDSYESLTASFSTGPQIEGLTAEELVQAETDPDTSYIDTDRGRLPFLTRLSHASWLNPDFFERKGYDPASLRYCILPQELLRTLVDADTLSDTIAGLSARQDLSLLIDYPENSRPFYEQFPVPHTVDVLTTADGTPAATYHYETVCRLKPEGFAAYQPDPSIRHIKPEEVDEYAERIWEIYSLRFQDLVDDHPIAGMMKKEDLLATLKSNATQLAAYFDEAGEIQSFGYVIDNLDLCPWLNQSFFQAKAQGRPLVYMPGIASSPNAYVSTSTRIMNSLLYERFKRTPEFVLTFECSNMSAGYIPRLVKRAFDNSGMVDYDEFEELKHYYRVVNFNSRPKP